MNILIWLVMGGLIGWVASLIMGTNAQQGIIVNVIVGIVGAVIGGWLIAPLVGSGAIGSMGSIGSFNEGFTVMNFIVSLIGAMILLFGLSFVRRGSRH